MKEVQGAKGCSVGYFTQDSRRPKRQFRVSHSRPPRLIRINASSSISTSNRPAVVRFVRSGLRRLHTYRESVSGAAPFPPTLCLGNTSRTRPCDFNQKLNPSGISRGQLAGEQSLHPTHRTSVAGTSIFDQAHLPTEQQYYWSFDIFHRRLIVDTQDGSGLLQARGELLPSQ